MLHQQVKNLMNTKFILDLQTLTNMDHIACIYDGQWWLVIVKESDQSEKVIVHFFHPSVLGPDAI